MEGEGIMFELVEVGRSVWNTFKRPVTGTTNLMEVIVKIEIQ